MCINKRFTMAKQCVMVDLLSAPLVQSGVLALGGSPAIGCGFAVAKRLARFVQRDPDGDLVRQRGLFLLRGACPSPAGRQCRVGVLPLLGVGGGQYVELYNTSTSFTFDLSAWQIQGLS